MQLLRATAPTGLAARAQCTAASSRRVSAPAPRLVAARYQGSEQDRFNTNTQLRDSPYYNGHGDDPYVSLRGGWEKVKRQWDDWEPAERNNTLALGAGGALALYLANGLLSAIDRLPLLPATLQLVGLAFSSWFTWRYLLFADGRQDLSRLSLDQVLGRSAHEATSDLSRAAHEAADGVADGTERVRRSDPVGRAWDSATSNKGGDKGSGSGRLSDGGQGGYSSEQLDSNVQAALKDLEKLAE